MFPLRDVIPTRTRPGVIVTLAAAHVLLLAPASLRPWWLLWGINAWTLWIVGSTLEDRLGHARVAVCAAAGAAAAVAIAMLMAPATWAYVAPGGAVAGLAAAYMTMFPRSRVLALVPVPIGLECIDVPAWFVVGLWAVVHVAATGAVSWPSSGLALAAGWTTGAGAGCAAAWALRRPERMTVEWWDGG